MNKDHINEIIELIRKAYLVEFIDGLVKIHFASSSSIFELEQHFEISELDAYKLCCTNYKAYRIRLNDLIKYLELYRDTGEINLKKAIENENKPSNI